MKLNWSNYIGCDFSYGSFNSKILNIKLEKEDNFNFNSYYYHNHPNIFITFDFSSSGYISQFNNYIYILDDKYKTQISGLYFVSSTWSSNHYKDYSNAKFQISDNFSYLTYTHEEWEVRDLLL